MPVSIRVGQGFDVHPFSDDDRPLVLGGVVFEGERGLAGHSDADAIAHAVTDALLGAAGLGDIGQHFPDTDPALAGADSMGLLRQAVAAVRAAGWEPVNVDCTVVLEAPEAGPAARRRAARPVGGGRGAGHREGQAARGPGCPRPRRGRRLLRRRAGQRRVLMARPPRKGTKRSASLPKAPTRRSPTPGRVPSGGRGRPKTGAARGKQGSVGAGARSASPRRGLGGDQVEGRQAVRELLLARRRKVREIWLLAEQDPADVIEDIVELAEAERVPVRQVSRGKFFAEARCEAPQGVLAKAAPLEESLLDDLATTRAGQPPPFLVAVDGVTDPGNLGALLRSAECAGATGIVLPRHRAVHVTPTVTKAAAGAVEHLSFAIVGGLPAALQQLSKHGVWVVGLDGGGSTGLWDLPAADGPIALVLGAEGSGLSRLVRQRCDAVVNIPLNGALASLNVAAAAALACFEVARARAAN